MRLFHVSDQIEIPISVEKFDNLYSELFKRNVEVRILNNLWELGESVQKSTLTWSLCRMVNAIPKETWTRNFWYNIMGNYSDGKN